MRPISDAARLLYSNPHTSKAKLSKIFVISNKIIRDLASNHTRILNTRNEVQEGSTYDTKRLRINYQIFLMHICSWGNLKVIKIDVERTNNV